MKRRPFLLGAFSVALSHVALGQARPTRVGMFLQSRTGDADLVSGLREQLAAAGLAEGRDVVLQVESIEIDMARIPEAARRLLEARPDVIYATTEPLVDGLLRESRGVPIVFHSVTEPVTRGYVRTLARPGGQLTGVTDRYVEVGVKRLELLREIAPRARKVGVVRSDEDTVGLDAWGETARRLGLEVVEINAARQGVSLRAALDAGHARGVDCFFPLGMLRDPAAPGTNGVDPFLQFVAAKRLPAIYSSTAVVVRRGGLASMEIDHAEAQRLASGMVLRVLRGEKPEAMPVQEPDRFVVALNFSTAKAQGISFSHAVRVRATQVVE